MASVSQQKKAPAVNRLIKELKKALAEGRTTKVALAEAAGVSRMQIHRIITGENKPSLETAEALAIGIGLKITFTPAGRS